MENNVTQRLNARKLLTDKATGQTVLFDESGYNRAIQKFNRANEILAEISIDLLESGYEPTEEILRAIISRSNAKILVEKAVETFRLWADQNGYPSYLRKDAEKKAELSVSDSLVQSVDEKVESFYYELKAGGIAVAFKPEELVYSEKAKNIQLKYGFIDRLKPRFESKVSEAELQIGEKLCQLIAELREIDAKGFVVKRIVETFIGNRYAPEKMPELTAEVVLDTCRQLTFREISYEDAIKRPDFANLKNLR